MAILYGKKYNWRVCSHFSVRSFNMTILYGKKNFNYDSKVIISDHDKHPSTLHIKNLHLNHIVRIHCHTSGITTIIPHM